MKVIKRDGREVTYDRGKIIIAIHKANDEVPISERISDEKIHGIVASIEKLGVNTLQVEEIQDIIEQKLMAERKFVLAKTYIIYRYQRQMIRKSNTTDESILGLIQQTNKYAMEENSNKNAAVASTQRDLIAGEVSRDLTNRLLLPEKISKAHEEGILHFHDADYFVQSIFNCCLINISDMLDNGTVMNGKMIESPKSFQVACTVMTQIIAAVASSQYGGQSVDISHLGKYLRKTKEKFLRNYKEKFADILSDEAIEKLAADRTMDELKSGVQTIQYQINTLMTTNGQSPFVTLFLNLKEDDPYKDEVALIIEEILKQRIQGIKNEAGVYITPAFPKLIYVLGEHNCLKGGKYDYLTKLAVECSSKRMYPDYISAKKMRENYEGEVFSCMGCRSFLSPWKDENGNYKWEGRFNQGVVSINLPQMGIIANGNEELFWELMEERLSLCFEALMCRHKALEGTLSDVSPIHWQYGAIARLKPGEKIDSLLDTCYSTLSLGYIGLYECVVALIGQSHTTEEGDALALAIMQKLRNACDKWKKDTGLGFALYGTPAESTTYTLARALKKRFGIVPGVTDKDYITNSYHVNVREHIDAFSKLGFEAKFQKISSGGAISYVEVTNMTNNFDAMKELINYMYETIQYAEINTKSDYCQECGFSGEILLDENNEWYCPNCGNRNHKTLNVCRRTCGYLGDNFWNKGRTQEIKERFVHLDNRVYQENN